MYRESKGGILGINSFLRAEDRDAVRDHMLRTASSNMREAAKIGLQSLYANPEDVFKKYKDFDIVKEMQARKGAKLLWVRARAIDSDTVNANGDYFSKEELLKEIDVKGEKIPAYKTFEGCPIYTNHKNDDVEQAKGMVVYAEWDDEENCVYCTFFVDEEAYPDIARNIRTGVIHDVSMGCQVEWGKCSKCGNEATTEKDYCECLKKWKGKKHPQTGEKIYEKNYGLKFIELSCVGDGAFDTCEIQEIYDVDEILEAATDLEKRASAIFANIVLAETMAPADPQERSQYETNLRTVSAAAKQAMRLAQTAGTLVGGQLMAAEGSLQNSTVAAVLNALGIDPRAGLNILDLLNLSLNFLEVAVMNLFARKDNVDLSHVGKITKSMADLQSTMGDMIDDGVDVGGRAQAPINAPQGAQPINMPPGMPQGGQPGQASANYMPAGGAGRMVQPASFSTAFPGGNMQGIGGGVVAASSNAPLLVWASEDESGKREVYASRGSAKRSSSTFENALAAFGQSLVSLKDSLGVDQDTLSALNKANMRAANSRNTNTKTSAPLGTAGAGGNHKMDHFEKIASEQRKKLAAAVTIDFKVENSEGHRVVLSTNGSIKGYVKDAQAPWEPLLTEHQLQMMESGNGTRVAAELLKDFSGFVKTSSWNPSTPETVYEASLEAKRTGTDTDVKEKMLENAGKYSRKNPAGDKGRETELAASGLRRDPILDNIENQLDEDAGLYAQKVGGEDGDVKEALLEDARKGAPTEVIEEQLETFREDHGAGDAEVVMASAIDSLGKAVIAARVTPEEVFEAAEKLASREDLVDLIALAAMGSKVRTAEAQRRAFHKLAARIVSPEMAIAQSLSEGLTALIGAADMAEALRVAVSEKEISLQGITRVASSLVETGAEAAPVNVKVSRAEKLRAALASTTKASEENLLSKDHLKVVLSALAMASEDTTATPAEVVEALADLGESELARAINEARTASATEARMRVRARREFWGSQRVASKQDVGASTIGWLADYATNFEFATPAIVEAASRLTRNAAVAENLVAKAIVAKQKAERVAEMRVTQEKSDTIRFMCRIEDLGGIQPNDEGFEDAFRDKAIQVLQEQGFTVDPGTFSFTDLSIGESGDITASVSSRTSKTFKVDGGADLPAVPEGVDAGTDAEMEAAAQTVMTAAAKQARVARRQELLQRFAQQMPGVPGAPAPGMDLGMSALSVPTAAGGNPVPEPQDADAMPEEGKKYPPGSICPACGAMDVDLSNGNGHCNGCGTDFEVQVQITMKPNSDTELDKTKTEEEPPLGGPELGGPELGADMGLGGATAPAPMGADMGMGAPAAPMGAPGMGAPGMGMPGMAAASRMPIMTRIAYSADSDTYLRTASADFNRDTEQKLVAGMVCPKCGNRHAQKIKNQTICYECGNYARTTVTASKTDPTKVDVTITWIV